MLFKDLDIIAPILSAIEKAGYTTPTPIQQQAIPIILNGNDIIGCAQTGTGKTAAFAIPIIQLLHSKPVNVKHIQTLILTPTRELAVQINENFGLYKGTTGITHTVVVGGVSQNVQVAAIKKGAQIVIATPGRLLDLIKQGLVSIKQVETLVLDEADTMLDMGFIHDIKKILTHIPKKRQTLFFSATMPDTIRTFAQSILNEPKEVSVSPVSSTSEAVKQSVIYVDQAGKDLLLQSILKSQNNNRSLIFTRTKHGANKLLAKLEKVGIKGAAIHGNKSQSARQRALNDFKSHAITVLIATDIAARGIDIDDLKFVINYEIPNIAETYVHRIGRTGRGGNFGEALSFCSTQEKKDFKSIEKLIGFKVAINSAFTATIK